MNIIDDVMKTTTPIMMSASSLATGTYTVTLPSGGTRTTVSAEVLYIDDQKPVSGAARLKSQIVHLTVANSTTTGISTEEFDHGFTIALPIRKGATTTKAFSLKRIIAQDAGLVTYECR